MLQGLGAGLAYSKTERLYCWYISVRVSLCCQKSVPASVRSVRSPCVHFSLTSCMWSLKLSVVGDSKDFCGVFVWDSCVI